MKSKAIISLVAFTLLLPMLGIAPLAQAEGVHHAHSIVDVGNTICPVSGEKIGSHGDPYKVEHAGKSYNLCCKMCKKDFEKNPEKYIKKLEEMMGSEKAEDSHHEGSHHGHGDHDHGHHH